jgi:hypothetical protein
VHGSAQHLCVDPALHPQNKRAVIDANIIRMKTAITKSPIVGTLKVHKDLYSYDGKSVYTVDPNSPVVGWHAIEIVGWCDERINFAEPEFDSAYWIIRSSWGEGWGAKGMKYGFAYIRMGDNTAEIESRASVCDVVIPDFLRDAVASTDISTMCYTSYTDYVNDPERDNFVGTIMRKTVTGTRRAPY